MESQVVIINGLGGSGKSTFVDFCKKYVDTLDNIGTVYELSTVDYVKDVATFCGWDGKKEKKDRVFLHDLKIALEKWNNIPERSVIETIESIESKTNKNNVYFVNIREYQNIESFKQAICKKGYDCTTLVIINNNPNYNNNEVPEIISDIISYKYENIIYNSSDLTALAKKARDFINNIARRTK